MKFFSFLYSLPPSEFYTGHPFASPRQGRASLSESFGAEEASQYARVSALYLHFIESEKMQPASKTVY